VGGRPQTRRLIACGSHEPEIRQGPVPVSPIPDELWRSCRRILTGTAPQLRQPIDLDTLDLSRMPNNRSPVHDGGPYEFFKFGPPELKQLLLDAVNAALTTGTIPDDWRGGMVRLLLKKSFPEKLPTGA